MDRNGLNKILTSVWCVYSFFLYTNMQNVFDCLNAQGFVVVRLTVSVLTLRCENTLMVLYLLFPPVPFERVPRTWNNFGTCCD